MRQAHRAGPPGGQARGAALHRLRRPALSRPGGGFGSAGHLARRFLGSLRPAGPGVAGDAWAARWLAPGEQALWAALPGPDRRHAVAVAHRAAAALGDADGAGVRRPVVAAALLHDVGKLDAGLGTFGRVAATLAALTLGRDVVARWAEGGGGSGVPAWRARAGRYVRHDELGAARLAALGSDPLVVSWAAEHHRPPARWSVDPRVGAVLAAADDD